MKHSSPPPLQIQSSKHIIQQVVVTPQSKPLCIVQSRLFSRFLRTHFSTMSGTHLHRALFSLLENFLSPLLLVLQAYRISQTVSHSISILALNLFLSPPPFLDHCYHLSLHALLVALSLPSAVPPPLSLSPAPLLDLLLLLLPWLQYDARRHREPS